MSEQRPFPSDLTDEEWQRISQVLPGGHRRGRPRDTDLREVVNAIEYRRQTGCVWRALPACFPRWQTVYTYFCNWHRDGTLSRISTELKRAA